MTNPRLRAYYDYKANELDELALTYQNSNPYKRYFYTARGEAVLHALGPLDPNEWVLDIGGGTGFYAQELSGENRHILLTDLSYNILCRSDSMNPLPLRVCCDASHLPFRGNAFDKILFTEVLEHLPDGERALVETKRVLRNGGAIVVTTPSRWSPMNLAYGLKRHVRRYEFNEHLHEYRISEFRNLLSKYFELESFTFANYLVPYPFDYIFIKSISPRGIGTVARIEKAMSRIPVLRSLGWTMIARCRNKGETT